MTLTSPNHTSRIKLDSRPLKFKNQDLKDLSPQCKDYSISFHPYWLVLPHPHLKKKERKKNKRSGCGIRRFSDSNLKTSMKPRLSLLVLVGLNSLTSVNARESLSVPIEPFFLEAGEGVQEIAQHMTLVFTSLFFRKLAWVTSTSRAVSEQNDIGR